MKHKNTDLGFQFGSWLSGVLHVHSADRDGCCGDTEVLSGSSGVNSCGVLTKITSHLLLSGLQWDTERDDSNDRGFVIVACTESI